MARKAPEGGGGGFSYGDDEDRKKYDEQRRLNRLIRPGATEDEIDVASRRWIEPGVAGTVRDKGVVKLSKWKFDDIAKRYGTEKALAAKEYFEGALNKAEALVADKMRKLERFLRGSPEEAVVNYGREGAKEAASYLRQGAADIGTAISKVKKPIDEVAKVERKLHSKGVGRGK